MVSLAPPSAGAAPARRVPAAAPRASAARHGGRRVRAAHALRARAGSRRARRAGGRGCGWRRGRGLRGGRRARRRARRCRRPAGARRPRAPASGARRARRAPLSDRARRGFATAPRSALVTTSTSGISMIPAFRNCSASPEPGWTTTATVSAASATSVSDWPTPTVSITTTSNAFASACAAARVAGARPPSRSPAAIERMKTSRSAGSCSIRARSPSSAPPERLDDGSTASTATERPRARHSRSSAESSVDLPTPGGPVTPTTWPAPSPAAETSSAACSRAVRVSSRFSAAGAAVRSPAREALAEFRR